MAKNNVKELQDKLDEQARTIEDYINALKRLQADFENYIKRVGKEKEEFVSYSNHKLIAKLLIITDDFEKALSAVKKGSKEVAEGVEMIHKQLNKVLQEEGVAPIEAVGTKLDPFKHDVIDVVTGNEEGIIVEEIQRGYMIKEKVLRPAKVRISKVWSKDV